MMQERMRSMESQSKSSKQDILHTLKKKDEEGSKLREVLQEAKDKLVWLWEENDLRVTTMIQYKK